MTDHFKVAMKYKEMVESLIAKNITISTMESCTGGLIASNITNIEGSSAVFPGGFVTYGNKGKISAGVPKETIASFGVYSEETALAMARAAKENYQTSIGLGVTGSLGNIDLANSDSVPGKVHFAIVLGDKEAVFTSTLNKETSRIDYKMQVADIIIDRLIEIIKNEAG